MPPALNVQNLTISTGARQLVSGVTFTIQAGERVALLGASGSGKSLTGAAIIGSLAPTFRSRGTITVFGTPVATTSTGRIPRGVSAVYQDSQSALNPLVPIGVQLSVPVARSHGLRRRDARVAAGRLLASLGLEDPERTMTAFPAELSGGQRQRVCIALAMACRARLLVADEPTTALDVVSQARVLDVLQRYASTERAATLFITHDLAVAASLCDRAIVLQSGHVIEQSSMADLIDRPRHEYTQALVRSATRAVGAAA